MGSKHITATPGQCGSGSNGNEGVHHTPQIFITSALRSDTVSSHTQEANFGRESYIGYNQHILNPAKKECEDYEITMNVYYQYISSTKLVCLSAFHAFPSTVDPNYFTNYKSPYSKDDF